MITFREFLLKNEKSCSIVYDSFEIPCAEHRMLLDKMLASSGTMRVYVSGKEHLLERVKMLRKSFPEFGRNIILDEKLTDIKSIVASLKAEGFVSCKVFVDAANVDSLMEELRGHQTMPRFAVSAHTLNVKAAIEEMVRNTVDGKFATLAKRVTGDVTPLELHEHVVLLKNITLKRQNSQPTVQKPQIKIGDRLNTSIGESVVIATGCNTATVKNDAGLSKKFFIKDLITP